MGRIIGIDLGTTNSLAAYWADGESRLIPNALGNYLTPSVVSIDEDGTVYVGEVAKERLISHPERTVSVFKRSMGTDRTYQIGGKWYRPEELSALVLRKLKEDAERYLGEPVDEAVVSVPAYFGDMARRATRDAGQLAGLKVDRIVNEPSAAALACQHIRGQENRQIMVYDFGGGTLDVSLVSCFENIVEITAVSGDARLGGSDFDRLIAEEFCRQHEMHFAGQSRAEQEALLRSAEIVKKKLTKRETATMELRTQELTGTMELSRRQLIQLSGSLLTRLAEPIKTVLRDSGLPLKALDQVVLVGGSTKMPLVQQYMRYVLKDVPIVTANPDYMVALGTGIYAGIKERNDQVRDVVMTDICPFSLGIEVVNRADNNNGYMSVIIPRNSALPISRMHVYQNASDNQTQCIIGIYQGEELYVKNNTKLGELVFRFPPAPAGSVSFSVRFSYDINGLLVVHAKDVKHGEEKELVFLNGKAAAPDSADLQQRVRELQTLHTNPREDEVNRLLLAKAERLYTQLHREEDRRMLAMSMERFERVLAAPAGRTEVLRVASDMEKLLKNLELGLGGTQNTAGAETETEDFLLWLESGDEGEDELVDDWSSVH